MIPAGYTQVEYIESTGTQYIDAGFKPNQDTRVVCDAICTTGSTNNLFGARSASLSANAFRFYGSASGYYAVYYNGQLLNFTTAATSTGRITIDYNKNVISVVSNGTTHTVTATAETFTCEYKLYLFAQNHTGTAQCASARIYACQIYGNGILIRDFVPCTNANGEAGLYDKVDKQFYGNAGSGAFTAGPALYVSTPESFEQVMAVYLSWSAVDCEGYKIYRDGALLATTTNTFYADLSAEENETYIYTLLAYSGSVESAPVELTVYTRSGYFTIKPLIQSAFFQ